MLLEHLIYSTAFAIILGMIHYRFFHRDYSWIIIVSAFVPDLDIIPDSLQNVGITVLIYGHPIAHGNFHNLAILTLYAILVAFLLHLIGLRLVDSVFFAGMGFAAHLFEDALVFKDGYSFFWPLVPQHYGIGLIHYTPNFYGFANKDILIIGLILLSSSAILRTAYEGTGWIANYLPMRVLILSRKGH